MLATGLAALTLALLVAIVLSYLASMAWPALRRLTADGAPQTRSLVFLVYALLPPLSAAFTALLVMHPDWSAALVPEHCHGSNCEVHKPAFQLMHPAGGALAAVSVLIVLGLLLAAQRVVLRARRRLHLLNRFAEKQPVLDHAVVRSDDLLAWCAGLLAPRIFLSDSLVDACSPRELQIVLAHEHAHAKRRDNLRNLAVTWATLAWHPGRRKDFLRSLSHSTEAACDAVAARFVGSARPVIDLIERLPEMPKAAAGKPRLAFDTADRCQRVAALAHPVANDDSAAAAWLIIGLLWLAAPVLLTGPGHYLIEWLMAI
jgi:Zn-dependent protease with chaperone function